MRSTNPRESKRRHHRPEPGDDLRSEYGEEGWTPDQRPSSLLCRGRHLWPHRHAVRRSHPKRHAARVGRVTGIRQDLSQIEIHHGRGVVRVQGQIRNASDVVKHVLDRLSFSGAVQRMFGKLVTRRGESLESQAGIHRTAGQGGLPPKWLVTANPRGSP
jgi:hypothetical protein